MPTRVAIVDLDGTVYRGGSLIPGADRGVAALREAGYTVRFVSNSPTASPATYARKLQDMGIEATQSQVISSGAVTTEILGERHAEDSVFVVGSDGLEDQLRDGGVELTEDPEAGDVLLGSWDPGFDYGDMVDVLHLPADAPFYGTDPDRTYPTEDGGVGPGSGAIIGALEAILDRTPDQIFGKPSMALFEQATAGLDADPADCLVVGDRLTTDIEMGERAGARTVLLRSGVTDSRELERSGVQPDTVIDRLADIDTVL
jgi:HAD superfamily hydrolase (TIGR01450 family)